MERIKSFSDFIRDYKIDEAINPILVTDLKSETYTNLKLGDVPASDRVNKALLDDIETAARIAKVRVKLTAAKSDHPSSHGTKESRHKNGTGVDLAQIGYLNTSFSSLPGSGGADKDNPVVNRQFYDCANSLVDSLIKNLDYKLITDEPDLKNKYKSSLSINPSSGKFEESFSKRCIIWQSMIGGNHYNHVHVSSVEDESIVKVTPQGKPLGSPSDGGSPDISDDEREKLTSLLTGKKGNYVNPLTGQTGDSNRLSTFGELIVQGFKATTDMSKGYYYS